MPDLTLAQARELLKIDKEALKIERERLKVEQQSAKSRQSLNRATASLLKSSADVSKSMGNLNQSFDQLSGLNQSLSDLSSGLSGVVNSLSGLSANHAAILNSANALKNSAAEVQKLHAMFGDINRLSAASAEQLRSAGNTVLTSAVKGDPGGNNSLSVGYDKSSSISPNIAANASSTSNAINAASNGIKGAYNNILKFSNDIATISRGLTPLMMLGGGILDYKGLGQFNCNLLLTSGLRGSRNLLLAEKANEFLFGLFQIKIRGIWKNCL